MTGCGRQDDRLNDSFKVQRDEWMNGWMVVWLAAIETQCPYKRTKRNELPFLRDLF